MKPWTFCTISNLISKITKAAEARRKNGLRKPFDRMLEAKAYPQGKRYAQIDLIHDKSKYYKYRIAHALPENIFKI